MCIFFYVRLIFILIFKFINFDKEIFNYLIIRLSLFIYFFLNIFITIIQKI